MEPLNCLRNMTKIALDEMLSIKADHLERWDDRPCSVLPEWGDTPIYLGVQSASWVAERVRYMVKESVIGWQGLYWSSGELARTYLMAKYGKARRVRREQHEAFSLLLPMPLYCVPSFLPDAVYLDLKAAFWSIMTRWGWDIDYMPGKWAIPGSPPDDFPLPTNKVARNSLVTIGLPGRIRLWTGERVIVKPTYNTLLNSHLWRFICDSLHMIAAEAVKLGAVYIHTDGYILPADTAPYLESFIHALGLECGKKSTGNAWVFNLQSYKIGDHQTKRYHLSQHMIRANNLRPQARWLLDRWLPNG